MEPSRVKARILRGRNTDKVYRWITLVPLFPGIRESHIERDEI